MLQFLGRLTIWSGTISIVAIACLLIGFAIGFYVAKGFTLSSLLGWFKRGD